jgi:hypothetical protein
MKTLILFTTLLTLNSLDAFSSTTLLQDICSQNKILHEKGFTDFAERVKIYQQNISHNLGIKLYLNCNNFSLEALEETYGQAPSYKEITKQLKAKLQLKDNITSKDGIKAFKMDISIEGLENGKSNLQVKLSVPCDEMTYEDVEIDEANIEKTVTKSYPNRVPIFRNYFHLYTESGNIDGLDSTYSFNGIEDDLNPYSFAGASLNPQILYPASVLINNVTASDQKLILSEQKDAKKIFKDLSQLK